MRFYNLYFIFIENLDERALVEGAAKLGWTLSSRTPDSVTVPIFIFKPN